MFFIIFFVSVFGTLQRDFKKVIVDKWNVLSVFDNYGASHLVDIELDLFE